MRVAVLIEQDYEDLEVWYPLLRLREEGADAVLVGTGSGDSYRGKHGYPAKPQTTIERVNASEFLGVLIPGGWAPDRLRRDARVLEFVRAIDRAGGIVASICHGPWVLASAGILRGRKVTCVAAIRDDVVNAGANYEDAPVVRDGGLVTSRTPADLPTFARALIDALAEAETDQVERAARFQMPATG